MPTTPLSPLATTILWHTTPEGSHCDWLLQTPAIKALESHPLTAFRLPLPPALWLSNPLIPLIALPPHREIYLTHQGPVSNRRGFVLPLTRGTFTPHTWSASEIALTAHWPSLDLIIHCTLTQQSPTQWTLTAQAR